MELRKIDAASLAKLQQVAQEMQPQLPQHSAQQISQMMPKTKAQRDKGGTKGVGPR